jgi:hypothetical protein
MPDINPHTRVRYGKMSRTEHRQYETYWKRPTGHPDSAAGDNVHHDRPWADKEEGPHPVEHPAKI